MSPANFFTYSWPWRDVTPRLYYDARVDTANTSSTMHAKCVIVDDREVLITSANFTGRRQRCDRRVGVALRVRRVRASIGSLGAIGGASGEPDVEKKQLTPLHGPSFK